jgi:hypothetical protein
MKKLIIVAFVVALAACGGKKAPDTMNTGSGDGSAMTDPGSADPGSADPGSADPGSAAPEGGGSGM